MSDVTLLPPAVVVELVEAAESGERAETDRVREEDLRACVDPHLRDETRREQTIVMSLTDKLGSVYEPAAVRSWSNQERGRT